MPEELASVKEDEALFENTDPFVDGPISIDHGLNFKVGKGSFLNFNLLVLDTCLITIGENVLFGPNVGLFGAVHPMDPAERRGLKGPEAGKEIHIEDDVWIGAGASVLGGVRVGRGSTVGACSVVTKVNADSSTQFTRMLCLLSRCRTFLLSISWLGTLLGSSEKSNLQCTRTLMITQPPRERVSELNDVIPWGPRYFENLGISRLLSLV